MPVKRPRVVTKQVWVGKNVMLATHDNLTLRCPGKYVSQVQGEEAVVEVVAVVEEEEEVMAMIAMAEVKRIT